MAVNHNPPIIIVQPTCALSPPLPIYPTTLTFPVTTSPQLPLLVANVQVRSRRSNPIKIPTTFEYYHIIVFILLAY